MLHGIMFGVGTGNRIVGSVCRKVEVAAERPYRLDLGPGDVLTVPWLGTLITLLVIARGAAERGVTLQINGKPPRDVAECGPFQWSAGGHFEPGAIELAELTVRNDSSETVNIEVLLGFASEPTVAGATAGESEAASDESIAGKIESEPPIDETKPRRRNRAA